VDKAFVSFLPPAA